MIMTNFYKNVTSLSPCSSRSPCLYLNSDGFESVAARWIEILKRQFVSHLSLLFLNVIMHLYSLRMVFFVGQHSGICNEYAVDLYAILLLFLSVIS